MILTDKLQRRMYTIGIEAIRRYGSTAQIGMAVEECAELIVALRHHDRGRVNMDAAASELADVLIMCVQMASLMGPELVAAEVDRKLDRLEARLPEVSR